MAVYGQSVSADDWPTMAFPMQGGRKRYEGAWRRGRRQGQGTQWYLSGEVYSGAALYAASNMYVTCCRAPCLRRQTESSVFRVAWLAEWDVSEQKL